MKTVIHTYNAIETISWRILFTNATMKNIFEMVNDAKFIEVDHCVISTNQVTLVRQANGKEYFQKFILHTLHVSILWKMKSWVAQMDDPSIDDIFAQIHIFEEEERKYASALKSMTAEELYNRRKTIEELRNRYAWTFLSCNPDRAWIDWKEVKP